MKRRRAIILISLFFVVAIALYLWREEQREAKFIPQIQAAARRYDVDPLLVKAVVWRESKFRPDVRGRAGEIGLMQIQEIAAQEWADAEHVAGFEHEHCFNPATNTLAGVFYLRKLLKRYARTDDPLPYALADYNAGRSNLLKWNNGAAATNSTVFIQQIGFATTKEYVQSVQRRYALYRWLSRFGWS